MTDAPSHFLRQWRAYARLTQEQVAEGIGYERSYYSRIENGRRGYDQEILEKLAAFYRCDPADLIARDPATTGDLWVLARQLAPADLHRLTEIARTLLSVSSPNQPLPLEPLRVLPHRRGTGRSAKTSPS